MLENFNGRMRRSQDLFTKSQGTGESKERELEAGRIIERRLGEAVMPVSQAALAASDRLYLFLPPAFSSHFSEPRLFAFARQGSQHGDQSDSKISSSRIDHDLQHGSGWLCHDPGESALFPASALGDSAIASAGPDSGVRAGRRTVSDLDAFAT